jgi:hypothetical protein
MKIVVSHYRNGFDNTVEHSSKKTAWPLFATMPKVLGV